MKVQLLYFSGCPNVEGARAVLRRSLEACGLPPQFEEVDVTATDTPLQLRGWGSPTILINEIDVAGERDPGAASCRVYPGTDKTIRGVPSETAIRAALHRARPRRGLVRALAAIPGAALALLPSAHCPFCLGAYGAVVSSLGVSFLLKERVLAPLIAVALIVGVVAIAWSTKSHRHLGPLVLTALGSAAVACGRLIWNVHALVYVGGAVLVGASLWNLWLKRPRSEPLVSIRLGRRKEEAS